MFFEDSNGIVGFFFLHINALLGATFLIPTSTDAYLAFLLCRFGVLPSRHVREPRLHGFMLYMLGFLL